MDELDALETAFESAGHEFYVAYRRRRVGKTEPLKEFCADRPHTTSSRPRKRKPASVRSSSRRSPITSTTESLVEDNCLKQIQELVDHPAFTEPVRVMPDTHWGAGAPIGFTMPLPDRVVRFDRCLPSLDWRSSPFGRGLDSAQ